MARENLANVLLEGDTTQLNRALQKDVFSKEALRALQEPMLAILIAAGLYVALVQFGMSLASVMLLAFLLVRVLLYMSRMQREYQRMVTCESAYWSMQAAIEGAEERERESAGRRGARAARTRSASTTWASAIASNGSCATRRSRCPRAESR